MSYKNNVWFGVLLGIVLPVIAHLLTKYSDIVLSMMPQKPLGLYVLALTGNMIGVWYCYRNDRQQLGKGIVLVTFLGMLLAVITKTIVI